MTVKLKWSKECEPDGSCSYNHVWAETPFEIILIRWKGWKERPQYDAETPWGYEVIPADSLQEAKAVLEATWKTKVAECVGESGERVETCGCKVPCTC